ncbi:MAG: oligoendopeptidase F [Anaerovoracaceae bacterium]
MSKSIKKRDEIENKYKWNIESMYQDEKNWEEDLNIALKKAEEFEGFQGILTKDSKTLLLAFKAKDEIWLKLEKAYVYSRMRRDENNSNEKYQGMCDKSGQIIAKVSANMSFFVPELIAADEKQLLDFLSNEEGLKVYEFVIKDILREKAHVLSKEEENILAQMSELTPATNDIFTMLNNADIKFGEITDEDGNKVPLTHGNYINFLESHNRSIRQEAYEKMYTAYKNIINTVSTTYNYNTKTDVVSARIRKYNSARASALSGDNIPESVYDNLVTVINEYLPVLHKYMRLRKEILGIDELKMHDVYVPLVKIPDRKITFEEGLDIMREGLSPLGSEYINRMNSGISSGWIDVYENEGKTSGAYSFGSYDSHPFILLNYTNTLKDVFTVVHEMGHSMHSSYTREAQPFVYGGHSIFTAEVASTVNENLLMKHLISKEQDLEMKKYLINLHIEEFRTTVFRQTMFAEFEHLTHKAIEDGESLTANFMCEEYNKLNKKYFGDVLGEDDFIKYEWARIPHFYNAFYVYKYATGYSAATAISDLILENGPNDYLEFLKTGESDYPIELLKIAGVDMSSPLPIKKAMEEFKLLVDEFEKLL